MKIVVTADIHANMEALNAVLDSVKGQYDGFISLGDMVGYGPDPEGCIQQVKGLKKHIQPCILLTGNHEEGLLKRLPSDWFSENARRSLKKTASLISWKSRFFLARLRPLYFLSEKTLLVHGSPLEPVTEYLHGGQETAVSLRYLCAEGFKLCFCGHTHQAAVFYIDRGYYDALYPEPEQTVTLDKDCCIVNPGSVGFPRVFGAAADRAKSLADKTHFPAYFALWDTTARTVTFKAAYYDVRPTNEKIKQRLGTALL
ncbi:metallophosphoesterase [Treponema medium]|uniref:metallophosphoesterase family protein n=1 Tax=Treponema medium TaxID=58231 RepID=UPI00197E56DC|nr:metallophosphoesterase family protein [Treponema medium]QSH92106.1 metallophosphoesterase [Treponema medium]